MTPSARRVLVSVVSASEAAELLGVSRTRIQQLLKSDRLDWRMAVGVVLITRASLEEYAVTVRR